MEENQKQKKDVLLPASILIAAVLVAGAVIYSNGSGAIAPVGQNPPTANVGDVIEGDLIGNNVVLGDPNAPVTVVEFGDYQCPFCARMFSEVIPQLREEYIETGKVKMVFRDFAFLGPESQAAALASECAAEQGKFWAYHDELFLTELRDGREHNGNLSPEFLKSLAGQLGVDQAQFDECLDSGKYISAIEQDYNDGVAMGVRGTPATFINGRMISGAVGYDRFKAGIEEMLAEAGQ